MGELVGGSRSCVRRPTRARAHGREARAPRRPRTALPPARLRAGATSPPTDAKLLVAAADRLPTQSRGHPDAPPRRSGERDRPHPRLARPPRRSSHAATPAWRCARSCLVSEPYATSRVSACLKTNSRSPSSEDPGRLRTKSRCSSARKSGRPPSRSRDRARPERATDDGRRLKRRLLCGSEQVDSRRENSAERIRNRGLARPSSRAVAKACRARSSSPAAPRERAGFPRRVRARPASAATPRASRASQLGGRRRRTLAALARSSRLARDPDPRWVFDRRTPAWRCRARAPARRRRGASVRAARASGPSAQ